MTEQLTEPQKAALRGALTALKRWWWSNPAAGRDDDLIAELLQRIDDCQRAFAEGPAAAPAAAPAGARRSRV